MLIKPCGPAKKKEGLVMPKEVVNALKTHVEKKMAEFHPLREKCQKPRMKARLAKYLGKYDRSCRKESARRGEF